MTSGEKASFMPKRSTWPRVPQDMSVITAKHTSQMNDRRQASATASLEIIPFKSGLLCARTINGIWKKIVSRPVSGFM